MYIVIGNQQSFIERAQYEARETRQRFRLFEDPRMAEARADDPAAPALEDPTELNIICHGSASPGSLLVAEEDGAGSYVTYTPAEFIAALKSKISTGQIPSTVKTINFAACNIGLSWPGHPSWIAELQGLMAADEELNDIRVQGALHEIAKPTAETPSLVVYIPSAEAEKSVAYGAYLRSTDQAHAIHRLRAEKESLIELSARRSVLEAIIPERQALLAEKLANQARLIGDQNAVETELAALRGKLATSLASPVLPDTTAQTNRQVQEVLLRREINALQARLVEITTAQDGNNEDVTYYQAKVVDAEAELATLPASATLDAAIAANSLAQKSMIDSWTSVLDTHEESPFLAEFCARCVVKADRRLAGGGGLSISGAGGAGGSAVRTDDASCAGFSLAVKHFDAHEFSEKSRLDNSNDGEQDENPENSFHD